MNRYEFILGDLERFKVQASWDMEADLRFAEFINHPQLEIIRMAANGCSPWPIRKRALELTGITKIRLRTLRELVRRGKVEACWSGTGEGGWYEFNVRRIRHYSLKVLYMDNLASSRQA